METIKNDAKTKTMKSEMILSEDGLGILYVYVE